MEGIDYYPYQRKTKHKSKTLVLLLLIMAVIMIGYWFLTEENKTQQANTQLILISEPKILLKNNNIAAFESTPILSQPLLEMEQLDEVAQVYEKQTSKIR